MVTTGGTSLKDDIMRLYQPVHLLVGTPGRILDLTKKGVCVLKDCSVFVMDEVYGGGLLTLYYYSQFLFFIYISFDINLFYLRLISFYLKSSNLQWSI